jgi:RNA polymerase sigma factor (sigma-70 family)
MASGRLSNVRLYLRKILGPREGNDLSDGLLLERYLHRRDEAAFAALVSRYGPLVLGVCERVLTDSNDAEDAFQATFLVLVRKAGSLDRSGTLSHWLYTVAYRTAVKARISAARRRAHERQGVEMPASPVNGDAAWKELRPVLDEELNRLPEKYRAPLVLCYLEGKTHLQAARDLGWPSGSVSRRMNRARDLLRKRLLKRGIVLAPVVLAGLLAQGKASAAVPSALAMSTVKAAMLFKSGALSGTLGVASSRALYLADEMLRTVLASKLRMALTLLPSLCVCGLIFASLDVVPPSIYTIPDTRLSRAIDPRHVAYPTQAPYRMLHWGLETGIDAHAEPVLSMGFSPDGHFIAVGNRSPDHAIKMYDLLTGEERSRFVGHTGSVHAIAYSPNAKMIATGSQDRTIRLWDAESGRLVTTLRGHEVGVLALAFSPDGHWLVSGSLDKTVRLWSVATFEQRAVLTGHRLPVTSVAFAPNGKYIASASQDGTAKIWFASTGRERTTLLGHADVVSSVAFSPDSMSVATGSWDKNVKLWTVATGRERATFQGHTQKIRCIAFTADGSMVISGGQDKTIRMWALQPGLSNVVLQAHQDAISCIACQQGSMRFATGSADRTIKVWSLGMYQVAMR